jgi:X-Pro dipeptidyl-peptidase (S15 family)
LKKLGRTGGPPQGFSAIVANGSVPVIATTFPRAVRIIEHTLIPLKDGTTLAARIWLPEDAEQNPVPAILEYLPYRKRDGTYERDALTHPYFAGHGYAGVRVDHQKLQRLPTQVRADGRRELGPRGGPCRR